VTAKFIRSAANESQFLRDGVKTAVFAGRSNVGKSSVINLLTGQKNLARVGGTPGKTAHVNYFFIDETFYFADLPGYGYAKVSHAEKLRWAALLESFFLKPENIALGVLVTDARHKPTALDAQMTGLFRQAGIPFITLANKADKLKPSQLQPALSLIGETLRLEEPPLPVSSVTGAGKREILSEIFNRLKGSADNGTD
jgi:GTP-binding protein